MKNQIPIEIISASFHEWMRQGFKEGTQLRLGQWLMNNLVPSQPCSEIFYEENSAKALLAFYNKFSNLSEAEKNYFNEKIDKDIDKVSTE